MTFDTATSKQAHEPAPEQAVTACHDDDLGAARGILTGVLMGTAFWLLVIFGVTLAYAAPVATLEASVGATHAPLQPKGT